MSNILRYASYLAWMAVLLFSASCYKGELIPDRNPVSIPQEMKDYVYFKPGTYWIYKEEGSGIEDSVYVASAINAIDTVYDSEGMLRGIWEWFSIRTVSSMDGSTYTYSYSASWHRDDCDINGPQYCYWTDRTKTDTGFYGRTFVFFYKPTVSNFGYSGYSPSTGYYSIITITAVYDSVLVNNKYFHNVVRINDSKNITENDNQTNFFVSKNAGIIKKEMLDSNKCWNLERYNIYQ